MNLEQTKLDAQAPKPRMNYKTMAFWGTVIFVNGLLFTTPESWADRFSVFIFAAILSIYMYGCGREDGAHAGAWK